MTEAPAVPATPTVRVVRTARPVPLGAVLGIFRRGAGDPTSRRDDGGWWFAWRTPDGPVTLRLTAAPRGREVTATAWGSGAGWMLERVPGPARRARRPLGLHVPTTRRWPMPGAPFAGVAGAALGPRRAGPRARGHRAEGHRPGGLLRLPAPRPPLRRARPGPRRGARARRAARRRGLGRRPVVGVAARRRRPGALAHRRAGGAPRRAPRGVRRPPDPDAPAPGSRRCPASGRWTWAEVAQRALGLPDEVSFGDYHVAKNIGWALTGTPVDDDGLAELLEPYAGHRYRVQRLLELAGRLPSPPRSADGAAHPPAGQRSLTAPAPARDRTVVR